VTGGLTIVIVGASLAGLRAAETLRRDGFGGEVVLVGAEPHFPPYDRPPLSKQVLAGQWETDRARLKLDDGLGLDVRAGTRATALDLGSGTVVLDDGSKLGFDGLVIATGAAPRRLPVPGVSLPGVHVLRSVDDCRGLRTALRPGARLVVVGAGFIGMEVAATARGLGVEVTVVDPLPVAMLRAVGSQMGAAVAALHESRGVRCLLGQAVAGFTGAGELTGVAIADGQVLPADVAVVAVGAVPETAWLAGTGLQIDDGVVCDESMFAVGTRNVVAAGDVARWPHPLLRRSLRVEHWSNAVGQAQAAARNLRARLSGTGPAVPYEVLPYFWTDQYDWKLQLLGLPGEDLTVEEGSLAEGKMVAALRTQGELTGMLCLNWPARLAACRRRLLQQAGDAA
jgi:3-phenylpropionate/trans-cinnamate dioxygenase ferredoxin reductase component